ncbi:uncharacterized protein LY89DRAFT_747353, partial [Mollisia scopiformis]
RAVLLCTTLVYCFLTAAITFGYAPLKPILIQNGFYQGSCHDLDASEEYPEGQSCPEQVLRLDSMFTIAAAATHLGALPVGSFLDRFGSKATGYAGSGLLALGAILFPRASVNLFDAPLVGYVFLALGGRFVFTSSLHLHGLFPKHSNLVGAFLAGSFDGSSAVFLIFSYFHDSSRVSLEHFFTAYLSVPIFVSLVLFILMPTQTTSISLIDIGKEDLGDDVACLLPGYESEEDAEIQEKAQGTTTEEYKFIRLSSEWPRLHRRAAMQQMKTSWFFIPAAFTAVQILRINYTTATIRLQYSYFLSSKAAADSLADLYGFALPLGSLLSIPVSAWVVAQGNIVSIWLIVVSSGTLVGLIGCLPWELAGTINIWLSVIYAPMFIAALIDYIKCVFGLATMGTIFGSFLFVSGIVGLIQGPLEDLTAVHFENNPLPINMVMTSLTLLLGISLTLFIFCNTTRKARSTQVVSTA